MTLNLGPRAIPNSRFITLLVLRDHVYAKDLLAAVSVSECVVSLLSSAIQNTQTDSFSHSYSLFFHYFFSLSLSQIEKRKTIDAINPFFPLQLIPSPAHASEKDRKHLATMTRVVPTAELGP